MYSSPMEKDTILLTLQEELRTKLVLTEQSVPRRYQFPESTNMIHIALGMRRSGKTYFFYQIIRKLQMQGVLLERVLYIDFADDRLQPMDHKAFGELIDMWYALHPENHNSLCYLFFDEVHHIEGWGRVLRRVLDTRNVQLYVTGSSAHLLNKESATTLRGRSLSIEIFPYNYFEYLITHSLPMPASPFGQKMVDQHCGYLLDYFQVGGFPEVQSLLPNERVQVLQSYLETVIFIDIVERDRTINVTLLKYFISSLLKNSSSTFSINKFCSACKSDGFKVGKESLETYLGYLEEAFLIFAVPHFTEPTQDKKIYAIDNGLISTYAHLSESVGKFFENQIYLDLRRQKKEIFFYKTSEGSEVDFVTRDLEGNHEIIQLMWDSTDLRTLEKKKRALEQAERELGFSGRLIDFRNYFKQTWFVPR